MTDLATRVNVEKLDADSKPLSGAKLQLLDKNGDLIDEWTSDGKAHTLTAKLTAGETYTAGSSISGRLLQSKGHHIYGQCKRHSQ